MAEALSLASAKQRYAAAKEFARREAARTLSETLQIELIINNLSKNALAAVKDWPLAQRQQHVCWDWDEIRRRYVNFDVLDLAVWEKSTDRLLCVGICSVTSRSVSVEFMEGDPAHNCPAKGQRFLLILEAATLFAQKLGKDEIRLRVTANPLISMLETRFGFTLVNRGREGTYYCKETTNARGT